jgi:hypothetical protein
MLVVDALHEIHLGIKKAVLTHFFRILHTIEGAIDAVDQRYCSFIHFFGCWPYLLMQVLSYPNIQQGYYLLIFEQCLSYEKACCARL